MYHVAFTPNVAPANALSVKHPTLLGALAELFQSLDSAFEMGDWIMPHVLEAAKEAVDNLENDEPAKGVWTDMGCEDDAFSIDIFCEDNARFVRHNGDYLLAPHGAVALAIGEHNHQEWIYDESELADWDKVLRPIWAENENEKAFDEAVRSVVDKTTITELIRNVKDGDCELSAKFTDGSTRKLFNFYIDELAFVDCDLIGKTESEAIELKRARDVKYLQS